MWKLQHAATRRVPGMRKSLSFVMALDGKIPMVRFVLLCVLVFNVVTVAAQDLTAEMVDFGVYDVSKSGRIKNENVAGGLMSTDGKRLIKSTDEVDAVIGTNFGYRYRFSGPMSEVRVTIKVTHPPLRDPSTGKVFYSSEWSQYVPVGSVNWNTGWYVEEAWEVAPGSWTIGLYASNKLLLQKVFFVRDGRLGHHQPIDRGR